jgi:hypothetical protein
MNGIWVDIVISYLLVGFFEVQSGLSANPIDRPMWAIHPTFGKKLLVGILWPRAPFAEIHPHEKQIARARCIAVSHVLVKFAPVLLLFMLSGWIGRLVFADSILLRGVTSGVILILGFLFLIPFLSLPIVFLFSFIFGFIWKEPS